MRIFTVGAAAILAMFALATNALAAPIYYDEAVDGDIAQFSTFNLDFGANTFVGTVSGGQTNLGFDNDTFTAFLPSGSIVDTIELMVTPTGSNGIGPSKFEYRIENGLVESINPFSGGDFTIALGVAAAFLQAVGFNNIQFLTIADYQITINVLRAPSEVPLPAALPLFLAGLGATGFLGRRKKRALAAN
jgi:PEP-CTERM motif